MKLRLTDEQIEELAPHFAEAVGKGGTIGGQVVRASWQEGGFLQLHAVVLDPVEQKAIRTALEKLKLKRARKAAK